MALSNHDCMTLLCYWMRGSLVVEISVNLAALSQVTHSKYVKSRVIMHTK
jgi:hypothetical protein